MASSEVLDFDRLLSPISEAAPAGTALREDPATSALYFQVKDAREQARAAERKKLQRSMMTEEEKEVDPDGEPVVNWEAVSEIAERVVSQHSKDLWVAAWWIEALARKHGFAGLRDGFRLVRELIERYWDQIHPRPDEDGIATTVAQLAGLNGEDSSGALIRPIEQIPLTPDPPLTSADYEDALEAARKSATGPSGGAMTGLLHLEEFAEFKRAVNAAGADYFTGLLEDIAAARAEFQQLEEVLEEKCGMSDDGFSQAPPTSNIRRVLEEVEDRVLTLTSHMFSRHDDLTGETGGEIVAVQNAATPAVTSGAVQNREDAFRVLLKVADFFQATEPHSPVSYALQQAVRWGRMSLPELMQDLISDEQARNELFRRAGIPRPEEDH